VPDSADRACAMVYRLSAAYHKFLSTAAAVAQWNAWCSRLVADCRRSVVTAAERRVLVTDCWEHWSHGSRLDTGC